MFSFLQDMLDASFRGIHFHCLATSESVSRALAVHEYPFRDGGELDDMGRRTRRHQIRAIFYGPGHKRALERFLTALDVGGEGELIHPVYGAATVMVENYSVDHDAENPDSCNVQVTFVESGQENPFFSLPVTTAGKAESAAAKITAAINGAVTAASSAFKELADDITQSAPAGVLAELGGTLKEIAGIYNAAASTVTLAIDYLAYPAALVAQLRGQSAAALTGSLAKKNSPYLSWKNAAGSFQGISLASARPTKDYKSRNRLPQNIPGSQLGSLTQQDLSQITSLAADLPALETPQRKIKATAALLANLVQTETLTGHVAEMLLDQVDAPTLHPHELEAVVMDTRERIQDGVEAARAILPQEHSRPIVESLRDAALHIQTLGTTLLQAQPPLKENVTKALCNHHLLAHALYQDHTRAHEILRLNPHLRMPNYIQKATPLAYYANKNP